MPYIAPSRLPVTAPVLSLSPACATERQSASATALSDALSTRSVHAIAIARVSSPTHPPPERFDVVDRERSLGRADRPCGCDGTRDLVMPRLTREQDVGRTHRVVQRNGTDEVEDEGREVCAREVAARMTVGDSRPRRARDPKRIFARLAREPERGRAHDRATALAVVRWVRDGADLIDHVRTRDRGEARVARSPARVHPAFGRQPSAPERWVETRARPERLRRVPPLVCPEREQGPRIRVCAPRAQDRLGREEGHLRIVRDEREGIVRCASRHVPRRRGPVPLGDHRRGLLGTRAGSRAHRRGRRRRDSRVGART
jgi:hypothetical protein